MVIANLTNQSELQDNLSNQSRADRASWETLDTPATQWPPHCSWLQPADLSAKTFLFGLKARSFPQLPTSLGPEADAVYMSYS